jgi:hypothetical protein
MGRLLMQIDYIGYEFVDRHSSDKQEVRRYLRIYLEEFGDQGSYIKQLLISLDELKQELEEL